MGAHSRIKYEDLGLEKQPGKLPLYEQLKLPLVFSGGSVVKNLTAKAGDEGLIPGSGRSLEEGTGSIFA